MKNFKPSYPAILTLTFAIGLIVIAILDPTIRVAVVEVGKAAVAGYIGYASHTQDERL
jgi:hypothetical protein